MPSRRRLPELLLSPPRQRRPCVGGARATAIARIEDASDEPALEETLRQVKVVEFPRAHATLVIAAAFRWRIAHAGTVDTLDVLVGDIRSAKLPDAVRKGLADLYATRRKALASKDNSNTPRP